MQNTFLILFLSISYTSIALASNHLPLSKENYDKLVLHLDKKKFKDADSLVERIMGMKKFNSLLLRNCSGASYGAPKVIEGKTTITLEGKFWIRDGDDVIIARSSKKSYVIIHKDTMRVIAHEGAYKSSRLLK